MDRFAETLLNIEKSTYCPLCTSQDWPNTWYKWLTFFPEGELKKMVDIFSKKVEDMTEEEKNIVKNYHDRKEIAKLIYNHQNLKYFTYKNQQQVEKFTKENNLNDLIEEKLSYFVPEERQKMKEKVMSK